MADSSHLHQPDDNDDPRNLTLSNPSQNNQFPHNLEEFHVPPSDRNIPSSQDFFRCPRHRFDPTPPPISSPDRENQVNFVIDMFHQRVEQSQSHSQSQSQSHSQSQSQSHSASRGMEENRLIRSDCSVRVLEDNDDDDEGEEEGDVISNEFEVDFGAGSGLGLGFLLESYDNPNCDYDCDHDDVGDDDDDDGNSGFMVADSGGDWAGHGARSESGDSFQGSDVQAFCLGGMVTDIGSDSDDAGENGTIEVVGGGGEEESSLQLCWDAFQLENDDVNPNLNGNEDFEWEEVDDRVDDREVLSVFFGAEPDDDASVLPIIPTGFEEPYEEEPYEEEPNEEHEGLEWQVLSNVHNFEPNPDFEDQYDDYNYTEYEMFFAQFADSDAVSSSGRPPASKTVVVNLSTVVMTEEDAVKNNVLCAVCKDELAVGEMATVLPCSHRYHGECILPWLAIRNTCPVCRHELPTDDLEYERRKAERAVAHA